MYEETHIELPSLKGEVSEVEWRTRVDLAACYRLVDMVGMSDMINSHISALPEAGTL